MRGLAECPLLSAPKQAAKKPANILSLIRNCLRINIFLKNSTKVRRIKENQYFLKIAED
jgi:hypothetical protein